MEFDWDLILRLFMGGMMGGLIGLEREFRAKEAGLRTHNIYSPWPEEMNRQITGRISTYDFAPSPLSRQNLLDEGVDPEKITVTGNTVVGFD